MTFDPKHLMQLAAIIGAGSLGRAAKRLGMTQPALSRNIKIMESQAGGPLLLRDRAGARPTPLGRTLGQFGENILKANENANIAISTVGTFQENELRIATTPLLSGTILCQELPKFLESQTSLSCRILTVHEPSALVDSVVSREADLSFGNFLPLPSSSRLKLEKFFSDRLAVIARPGHRLFKKKGLTFEDLMHERWIVHNRSDFFRLQVDTVLRHSNIDRIDIACEVETSIVTIKMVKSSDYLAMLPLAPLSALIASGEILPLPLEFGIADRSLNFLYRRAQHRSQATQAFLEFMRAQKEYWMLLD